MPLNNRQLRLKIAILRTTIENYETVIIESACTRRDVCRCALCVEANAILAAREKEGTDETER